MYSFVDNFFNKNQIKYSKISTEILEILSSKPVKNDVSDDLFNLFEQKFSWLLDTTFSAQVVVWYAEVITEEIVTLLHNYFRNKCCNIENVVLMTSSSGIATYYKEYCSLHRSVGMQIVEIPMVDIISDYDLDNLKVKKINKNLTRFFSFYGGTYEVAPPTRTFLSLFVSQYKEFSSIEIMCKCETQQKLNDWLEYETFFTNSNFVEKYSNLHKTYINKDLNLSPDLKIKINKDQIFNEQYGTGDYQEIIDSQCLLTLVRETVNFQPFAYISEKTFRCFYNHTIPIPIDGKEIIKDLKDYGFWIDEDFFDYSYLQEDLFVNKIEKLDHSIRKITNLSYSELSTYYLNNIENFENNQKLLVNWSSVIKQKLNENFIK